MVLANNLESLFDDKGIHGLNLHPNALFAGEYSSCVPDST